MKLRSDPINTFNYETLERQFQTTLMMSKAEHYKTCAKTLNARARAQISRKPKICLLVSEKQYQWDVLFQMPKF